MRYRISPTELGVARSSNAPYLCGMQTRTYRPIFKVVIVEDHLMFCEWYISKEEEASSTLSQAIRDVL
jgi:hypothetical protein